MPVVSLASAIARPPSESDCSKTVLNRFVRPIFPVTVSGPDGTGPAVTSKSPIATPASTARARSAGGVPFNSVAAMSSESRMLLVPRSPKSVW